ncbi:uncharacterized protein LOC112454073 [Temnothorax curvispinosus]|uniref:Uncharacterized protein LOC112454073 n=1 Tax=Temnothorax curvispinosus TaxID=300111 RepID=A0A6J1PMY2_9HYME|nr:uncharacterized protein LOC112454073 [Temnothorax curvispinosus]XP_024871037.1 uncharacterized protein LOC112454073 [Temnothorax curvispinosus]XP_024871038.1 uncharacterized protein LOC112454073 [Temnothorax curvispinosus]XP_024871039.1 uncharacterized protein LOC112454073 [Temnothorax curvispinosus]
MEIQTFVFFDLETTGLIQGKVMPKITEIALVAVSRESICNGNKNFMPRVLHKMVLPVNPRKVIPPNVEHLTKLYNEDMQLLQPFENKLYELITHFLQRLTPPICFAAHNGDKFDYPIFLGELERINKIFNNEILCIDTWKMFQDFFKKRDLEPKVVQDLLNDEYNDSLSMLDMDVVMEEVPKVVATTSTVQTMLFCGDKYTKVINNNVEKYSNDTNIQSSNNPLQETNEKTPKNQIMKLDNVFAQRPFKKNNSKKRLNFECEKPISLKLNDIYEYMFGLNFSYNHSAEADCLAMIRCVINIADFFLDWSDNHAVPLICCKKT